MIKLSGTGQIYSFEDGIPEEITADSASALSISGKRFKDGKYSLRWDYGPGSRLTVRTDIGFTPFVPNPVNQSLSTFGVWVYCEIPAQEKLKFVFGKDDRADCWFEFGLSYSGWRTAWVAFERDMEGTPQPDMNTLTIVAPAGMEGTVYIDQLITCTQVDPRHHTRDEQVPFVNMQGDTAANSHWLALLRMNETLKRYLTACADADELVSYEEEESLHIVRSRWDQVLVEHYSDHSSSLDALQAFYRSLEIEQAAGGMAGRPVTLVHIKDIYPKSVREELQRLTNAVDIRDVSDFLLKASVMYRHTDDESVKNTLRAWFVHTLDHLDDQGWASGCSQGTVHHLGYNLTGLYVSCYLMKDVLQEAGILDRTRRMLGWYSGLGRIAMPDEEVEGNADIFNTTLAGMMSALLLTEAVPEAVQLLRRLKQWLDLSVIPARGLRAMFKPDGAVYHHVNHYPAYAVGGLKGLLPVVRTLGGTSFRLSASAHETIRKSLFAMRFYSNKTQWLISLSARHPTGKWELDPELYREMALAGAPDGSSPIDREMAAAYLRLSPSSEGNRGFAAILEEAGIKLEAEPEPTGHWTMNYACATFHRRDSWLAGVRGFSRYIWGNETYVNCNLYGRYIAYGHLQIMAGGQPVNHRDSGYVPEGWDWNRWPGTTVIRLPFEKLRADVRNVDKFSGFEEMIISDEAYAGGLSLGGENGMFAMKLHEHAKYNGSHRARKSYFFFANLIIALGSDIENNDQEHETETILLQNYIPEDEEHHFIYNKGGHERLPYEASLMTDEPCWILDHKGNGYYLPSGQQIMISGGKQSSPHQKDDSHTEGCFSAAWIAHGRAPHEAAYEYAVLVQTNEAELKRFTEAMNDLETAPYTVLQKNKSAHIVYDRDSNTTAYALFEAGEVLDPNRNWVLQTDTPCMAMARILESGEMRLSVTDPDLRLYEGTEPDQVDDEGKQREVSLYSRQWIDNDGVEHWIQLRVRGDWRLCKPDSGIRLRNTKEGYTKLEIRCKDAIPVQLSLMPV